MQALRDAVVLLVILLVVTTVRISPAPQVQLSPAHAAAPGLTLELGAEPAPQPAAEELVEPPAEPEAPCRSVLTARKPCPKTKPATPCDA